MKKDDRDQTRCTIIERLLEPLADAPATEIGRYDDRTQTWSHRDAQRMSPVKHNHEY